MANTAGWPKCPWRATARSSCAGTIRRKSSTRTHSPPSFRNGFPTRKPKPNRKVLRTFF